MKFILINIRSKKNLGAFHDQSPPERNRSINESLEDQAYNSENMNAFPESHEGRVGPTPDRKYEQCIYNTRSSPELSGQMWSRISGFYLILTAQVFLPLVGLLCVSLKPGPAPSAGDSCRGDDCFKMEQIASLFQSAIIEQEDHLVEDSLRSTGGGLPSTCRKVGGIEAHSCLSPWCMH